MEMGIKSLIDISSSNAFQFWVLRLHPYNNINLIAEKTPQKALQVTKQMYQFWWKQNRHKKNGCGHNLIIDRWQWLAVLTPDKLLTVAVEYYTTICSKLRANSHIKTCMMSFCHIFWSNGKTWSCYQLSLKRQSWSEKVNSILSPAATACEHKLSIHFSLPLYKQVSKWKHREAYHRL